VDSLVQSLVARTNIPFLPTPMGKGVVPDDHALNASAARSMALAEADVIVLVGARLNWILHYGRPPRFAEGVRVVQMDVCPEEFSRAVPGHAHIQGNL
jgi:2-hydroxyacyl-CoA lyase 1